MRKTSLVLFSSLAILLLGSCGTQHSHTFASEWTHDENNHWHASTCGHDVKSSYAEHTPGTDGKCSVCGYQDEAEVKRTKLIEVYGQLTNDLYEYKQGHINQKKAKAISDYDSYYSSENIVSNTIQGTYAYIKFCKSLYTNVTYPIIDKPVEFDANLTVESITVESNHMKFLTVLDVNNNKITGDIYDLVDGTSASYIRITIDYNFATNTINSLNLYVTQLNANDEVSNVFIGAQYANGVLKEFQTSDQSIKAGFASEINTTFYTPYKEKLSDTYSNNLDFSSEYTASIMG